MKQQAVTKKRGVLVGIGMLISGLFGLPTATAAVSTPEYIDVVDKTAHSVTLMWNSDMRSIFAAQPQAMVNPVPYTKYHVSVVDKRTDKVVQRFETSTNVVKIKNLKKNRRYQVKVVVERAGDKSAPLVVTARTKGQK